MIKQQIIEMITKLLGKMLSAKPASSTKKVEPTKNVIRLKLKRKWFTIKSTIGELYINNQFECYTLEDTVREGEKIYGETAIPRGRYNIIINYSPKFKQKLPRLLDVPNYTGILIHAGNYPKDTQGCILVGQVKGRDRISQSRAALTALMTKLESATDISIDID